MKNQIKRTHRNNNSYITEGIYLHKNEIDLIKTSEDNYLKPPTKDRKRSTNDTFGDVSLESSKERRKNFIAINKKNLLPFMETRLET